jgi:adenosylhomocysteine nucleosidase
MGQCAARVVPKDVSAPMIVAVTGLGREARLISRPDITTVIGGGDSSELQARIRRALDAGARRVLSIGICGALSPALDVGDCIVATEVVTEKNERFAAHAPWVRELLDSIPEAIPASLAGSETILSSSADKRRLYQTTSAAVADMESHVAARVAEQCGLPFAAVRVVSDSASRTLPPAAMVAMTKSGDVDVFAVLRSLVAKPAQIPALIRTAWEAEKAFRVLLRCKHVVDPGFVSAPLGALSLDMG